MAIFWLWLENNVGRLQYALTQSISKYVQLLWHARDQQFFQTIQSDFVKPSTQYPNLCKAGKMNLVVLAAFV